MKNQNDYIRVTFRCPPELHQSLSDCASNCENSLNSEIIKRLTSAIMTDTSSELIKSQPKKALLTSIEEIRTALNKLSVLSETLKSSTEETT